MAFSTRQEALSIGPAQWLGANAEIFGWILAPSITSRDPQRLSVWSFRPGQDGPGRIEWRTI